MFYKQFNCIPSAWNCLNGFLSMYQKSDPDPLPVLIPPSFIGALLSLYSLDSHKLVSVPLSNRHCPVSPPLSMLMPKMLLPLPASSALHRGHLFREAVPDYPLHWPSSTWLPALGFFIVLSPTNMFNLFHIFVFIVINLHCKVNSM